MTRDEFLNLQPGDLILSKSGERSLIVTGNYGNKVTAIMTIDITNPEEWQLILHTRMRRLQKRVRELEARLLSMETGKK